METKNECKDIAEQLELYHNLFLNAPEGFAVLRPVLDDHGNPYDVRYLEVNRAWDKATGLSRDRVEGRTSREVFSRVDSNFIETMVEVAVTGKPRWYESHYLDRWYGLNAFSPGQGLAAYTVTDITARKNSIESLKQSEERLKLAQTAGGIGIFDWDLKTNQMVWSTSLEELQGFLPGEFDGRVRTARDTVLPEDRELVDNAVSEALKTGAYAVDFRALLKNTAQIKWIHARGRVYYDREGKPVRLIGVHRDITQRKLAEEAMKRRTVDLERANQELEHFAYVASHDLREPLRMMHSFTQLLERRYKDRLDQEANEFIAFIIDGATRMEDLIDDLLTYSRVGTRGQEFKPTNMDQVCHQVLSDLKMAIEENDARISCTQLPVVYADSIQMTQILQNLISNAIKFRRKEEAPRVQVSATAGKKEWLFSVKDNGIGIEKEYFGRLFMLFQRLHSRERYPGTGIGLAVAKKIVQRHGGEIWVESEPGKGSTFFFTIPFRASQEDSSLSSLGSTPP